MLKFKVTKPVFDFAAWVFSHYFDSFVPRLCIFLRSVRYVPYSFLPRESCETPVRFQRFSAPVSLSQIPVYLLDLAANLDPDFEAYFFF